MAIKFDYSRGGRRMLPRRTVESIVFAGRTVMGGMKPCAPSLARPCFCAKAGILLLTFMAALPTCAQYPGQVTKSSKDSPELRAISVLEWTGDAGKPKTSRLVPVAVLDGGQLQDGGIYLARPQPLALAGEVEYELQQDGKPIGLFDIRNSGQEQGAWVGYGSWKPMPVARPKPSARELARTQIDDDAQSDQPVLHRKHHADEPSGGTGSGGGSGPSAGNRSGSSGQSQASDSEADPDRPTLHKKAASAGTADAGAGPGTNSAAPDDKVSNQASDPDRPTLHKKADSGGAADASSSPGTSTAGSSKPPADASSSQADDPDRPTLHKRSSSGDSAGSESGTASDTSNDPDRPTLHKSKKKQAEDVGQRDSQLGATDPDRPTLKRGKSGGGNLDVVPTLMGLPADMQQAVAVSDAKSRPAHAWDYAWSNPDDEAAMRSALEEIARTALGMNVPSSKAVPKRTTTQKTARKSAKSAIPTEPAPLEGEHFQVFELAYGSGATLVLTAHTDGSAGQQKFVTLIAQPDLYGNVLVLLKSVTDGAHLDETPRMRLVDAVDAMADNRGELLFELRGATQRQFALYRVLRGQAEKMFVSGGGEFGTEAKN